MLRTPAVVLVLPFLSMVGATQSQESTQPRGTVCWPLSFSGIVAGTTTDPQVRRLLGNGVFRRNEGDTGGRYFTDRKRSATLHVLTCTDYVVCEITLRTGIDPAIKPEEQPVAESAWFDIKEGFGNWHALWLGSSKEEVLKNLGQPKEKGTTDEWRYDTTCTCEMPEYFTLFFSAGRLVRIVLSAPAG